MKETLDEQSRKDLIQYRLARAHETLQEATLMADNMHFNAAMNRLYYACYYAIVSLLLKSDIPANTHAGVKTMFSLHYISKGILPKELGKTFSRLFEIRHSGDYDDFVYCDREMFDEYMPKAQSFVNTIQQLLQK